MDFRPETSAFSFVVVVRVEEKRPRRDRRRRRRVDRLLLPPLRLRHRGMRAPVVAGGQEVGLSSARREVVLETKAMLVHKAAPILDALPESLPPLREDPGRSAWAEDTEPARRAATAVGADPSDGHRRTT